MSGTRYQLEVNPHLPVRLERLNELANNLWYTWDRPTRNLFSRLHLALWSACGHSPKSFLNRVDQRRLDEAAEDPVFLGAFARVLSAFDNYMEARPREHEPQLGTQDLIAYFCAEFGFHESLPIYSGGLGILAGDHCKTASDLVLPFVGVGLLYRQGYFQQTVDAHGAQNAVYSDTDFDDLPIMPVLRGDGSELRVEVGLPGRNVVVKVWQAVVGHITLYLLDTDLDANSTYDRNITHRLYGGDRTTRIEQEIILGIGGVRALAETGLKPTVWHINEGHAAFLVLERMRQLCAQGLDFAAALEAVASNVVFTTHTPVPAGHDQFAEGAVREYFAELCRDMKIDAETLLALGRTPDSSEFNMTALAVRASRFQNGVSRIHGDVSAEICKHLWAQIDPEENPIDYITNGVHVPTFLSDLWYDTFDRHLGPGWSQRLTDKALWQCIQHIPDQLFWSVRQSIKAQMLHLLRHRVTQQHLRNNGSEAQLDRMLRLVDPEKPNVLTIGFARRFATYKRATLLFQNLGWLRQIIGNAKQPVLFLFAGKAHPADEPGQALIRRITEVAAMPEFEGHILFMEGYDLRLARRLVSGVDVWLNNPVYPLEASGTSGMKAAMNGVINLSVLDGWWGEGFDGDNGWAIKPTPDEHDDARRDQEESRSLYDIIHDKVIPTYYEVGPLGFSPRWVAMAKHAIATVTPRFASARMVGEYQHKFYMPAARQWQRYSADNYAGAREVAAWKKSIRAGWAGVSLRRLDEPLHRMAFGDGMRIEVAASLNGLNPEDVTIELLLARPNLGMEKRNPRHLRLLPERVLSEKEHLFVIDLTPEMCGKIEYRIRAFPFHEMLTHPFEMGMMAWL